MTTRSYRQYCGFARALEMVGERWALLIIRDLLVGEKRFTDLHRGLPGIPTNILTARLKELEQAGVLRRRLLPRPGGLVYELTEYGQELDDVVVRLGLWGAKSLGSPRSDEIVTVDSLVMALRTTFRREAAARLRASFELHVGEIVLHARVNRGKLDAGAGRLKDPDLVIETGPALKSLFTGELSPSQAIKNGDVRLTGNTELFGQFVRVFHVDTMPRTA